MTDFELNKAIAEALGINLRYEPTIIYGGEVPTEAGFVNYCNNWNDLMPLVVEYGISLCFLYGTWRADPRFLDESSKNEIINSVCPKRALAECLLKVLEQRLKEGG